MEELMDGVIHNQLSGKREVAYSQISQACFVHVDKAMPIIVFGNKQQVAVVKGGIIAPYWNVKIQGNPQVVYHGAVFTG